jgi:hypothetical protein
MQYKLLNAIVVCMTFTLTACTTLEIPKPPQAFDNLPSPPSESNVELQVSVPTNLICNAVNPLIPRILAENPGHPAFQYGVYRTAIDGNQTPKPLTCGGAANTLTIDMDFEFKGGQRIGIGGIGKVSCGYDGDPAKRGIAQASVPITLTPDWHLQSTPRVDVKLLDSCNLTILNINANNLILDKARPVLDDMQNKIKDQIQKNEMLKQHAQVAWDRSRQPLKLTDGVWLNLRASNIGVSVPQINGSTILVSSKLIVNPVVTFSQNQPPNDAQLPLPPISALQPTNTFSVTSDGKATWTYINKELNNFIHGKQYSWGIFKASIESAEVYGAGHSVVIALNLDGSIKGTAYLSATPDFDSTKNQVKLTNVTFTLETRQVLANVGAWFLKQGIEDLIAQQRYSLDVPINSIQNTINSKLPMDVGPARLSGSLSGIRLVGIYVLPDSIAVRANATGTASLTLR